MPTDLPDPETSVHDLIWLADTPTVDGTTPCPACRQENATRVAQVKFERPHARWVPLNRCHACQSVFYEGEDLVDAYDDHVMHDGYWRHYAEIGAGIHGMLGFVQAIQAPPGARLLDIGCGMGFVVDYWSRMRGDPAVGLEKASYGRAGAQHLGADIRPHYLHEAADLAGKTFDVVYSSEVIEHVPDPAAFLAAIMPGLADQGVLMLTTPCADALTPDLDPTVAVSMLFPGGHYFLLSAHALEALLRQAGFQHVVVHQQAEQLLAVASHRALPDLSFDPIAHEDYRAYMMTLADCDDRSFASGGLYRALKEDVNRGDFERGMDVWKRLCDVAKTGYGLDLNDPPITEILSVTDPHQALKRYPAWLGCAQYYGGMLMSGPYDDMRVRLRRLEAAGRLLRHEIKMNPKYDREAYSLLNTCDFHFLQAASYTILREETFLTGACLREGEAMPDKMWRERWQQVRQKLSEILTEQAPGATPAPPARPQDAPIES